MRIAKARNRHAVMLTKSQSCGSSKIFPTQKRKVSRSTQSDHTSRKPPSRIWMNQLVQHGREAALNSAWSADSSLASGFQKFLQAGLLSFRAFQRAKPEPLRDEPAGIRPFRPVRLADEEAARRKRGILGESIRECSSRC